MLRSWRVTTQVIAFLDHRPVFKGHVLVAPTRHVDTLLTLPGDLMVPLLTMTQRIAGAIVRALGAQGTFVAINNVVSQSIPHLHVHVVPRTKGDGLRGFFWPRTEYAPGEIERVRRADPKRDQGLSTLPSMAAVEVTGQDRPFDDAR